MSGYREPQPPKLCDDADREDRRAAMKGLRDEMDAMEGRDREVDHRSAQVAEETEFLKRQERNLCRFPGNRAGRRAAASKRRRGKL